VASIGGRLGAPDECGNRWRIARLCAVCRLSRATCGLWLYIALAPTADNTPAQQLATPLMQHCLPDCITLCSGTCLRSDLTRMGADPDCITLGTAHLRALT